MNPQVDAYVAQAAPFARPILTKLRALIHHGCPHVVETIKWSRPFFEYRGAILGNMAAFKRHCTFGFWGGKIGAVLRDDHALGEKGMGSLGRLASVEDLPSDKQMLGWIRQAAAFVDSGEYVSPIAARPRVVKAELAVPEELAVALRKNEKAAAVFAGFSASCKREYIEWIADAKRPETRDKRVASAIQWLAEGKQRNWKYQASSTPEAMRASSMARNKSA